MNEIEHERFQLVPVNEQGFPYEQATAARSGKENEDHSGFRNFHSIFRIFIKFFRMCRKR